MDGYRPACAWLCGNAVSLGSEYCGLLFQERGLLPDDLVTGQNFLMKMLRFVLELGELLKCLFVVLAVLCRVLPYRLPFGWNAAFVAITTTIWQPARA